ncbi:MAG TPA: thermostable hemolysin [Burkholderiales bacterium]
MPASARFAVLLPHIPGQRAALERFIAERFHSVHGARIHHFCAQLLGVRDALGRWQAGAGYTPAASGRLFLEQYLDQPVEALLAAAAGKAVARAQVAEVGNLAAVPGMGRMLIPAIGRHLHRLGYRWVVFTATRELRNAFRRLHLQPLELAPALPARLPDGGAAWGSSYAHEPAIMGGRIASCLGKR